MPKFKSMLNGNRVARARRKRKCYHSSKHSILKDEFVLEVKEGIGWKGYCIECAQEMISLADRELAKIQSAIDDEQG